MEIPYYVLVIPYLIGLLIFATLFIFDLYHIIKFGFFDFSGKINTLFFMAITGILLWFTFLLLKDISWFDTFLVSDIFSVDNLINGPTNLSL